MPTPAYVWIIGLLAQIFFTARMLFQWLLSEKARAVVSPAVYWILSLLGSYTLFVYGYLRDDFSIMLGQFIGYYVYVWNLKIKGVWQTIFPRHTKIWVVALQFFPLVACVATVAQVGWVETWQHLFCNNRLTSALLLMGVAGQVIFSLRFLYQWYFSSRRGSSILPLGFWWISLVGSMIIFAYGIIVRDPILLLAQGPGIFTYARNLWIGSHYGIREG